MNKIRLNILLLLSITILTMQGSFANTTPQGSYQVQVEENTAKEAKFQPGDFIFHHINDNYSWHIFSFKGKPYSIPLPVLLYSKDKGFVSFWSNKLEGGESYKGFKIAKEGDYKGKIIEVDNKDNFVQRPIDISLTKDATAIIISCILLIVIFVSTANAYKTREGLPPKGLQSFLEPIILFVRDDIAKIGIGEDKYEKYTPFLLTLFFFILINNLLGLIPIFPGGANITGNIAVTMVLAVITFIITTVSGNKMYWKHIFNPPGIPWWLKFPIPLISFTEFTGIFIKPFVLMVRLFANISAGHIIALSFFALIFIFGEKSPLMGYGVSPLSIAFTVFMSFLDLLVAFIQAYVFTLLSALYFGMATEDHHE